MNTHFLSASWAVRALHEQIYEIKKVNQQGVIQFFEFPSTIEMLGIQPLDSLSLEGSDDRVVRVEHVPEHRISVVNRWWWTWCSAPTNILVRVQINILNRRQR